MSSGSRRRLAPDRIDYDVSRDPNRLAVHADLEWFLDCDRLVLALADDPLVARLGAQRSGLRPERCKHTVCTTDRASMR